MEVNKDKLIEVLTKIEDRLSKIEILLNTKKDKYTNPIPTPVPNNTSSTKISKNTIDWDNLIYAISDTNQKNIVSQIYQNKYPTITEGQYNLINNIAQQNNFEL